MLRKEALIGSELKIEKDKMLEEVVKSWNKLVFGLIKVKTSWNRYRDLILENGISIEDFTVESQKILMKANPRGDFSLIIEDMITQGKFLEDFLKTQFIKLKEVEPQKEE